jgi:hypothetical protein
MQQSAFLRQLIADVAYWILFLKMVFVFDAPGCSSSLFFVYLDSFF